MFNLDQSHIGRIPGSCLRYYLLLTLVMLATLASSTLALQSPPQRSIAQSSTVGQNYYPGAGDSWEVREPAAVGMSAELVQEAVKYAQEHAAQTPRDFSDQVKTFGRLLGPLPKERGESNGLIIRHGYIVAEWGDTRRIDPTYSVAKSFLSTILGLTLDRRLIKNIHDPVARYVRDGGYDTPHNAKVTWHHHAQQTSEWEGSMWGKNHDFIGVEEFGAGRRQPRALQEPGTYYEYNDVRINRFALSLLRVWQRPLPEVLKTEIMKPIGASDTWQYHGYANSEVVVNGRKMTSVGGGTRWGGGLWINSRDQARFGLLFLREGNWRGKQIISRNWVRQAVTPGPHGPDYGYLWWLNTKRKTWPSAPARSFAALGAGDNTIWIDPDNDLVVVWRWHQRNSLDGLIQRVIGSIGKN